MSETSQTVVVELSREEARVLEAFADPHSPIFASEREAVECGRDKLRAALAFDSQGGDGSWPEITIMREKGLPAPHRRSEPWVWWGIGEYDEDRYETRRYVPSPTQPSISEEHRELLERGVKLLCKHTEGPDPYSDDVIALLRHLASAPPEPVAVIDTEEFEKARRDPRVKGFTKRADEHLATLRKEGRIDAPPEVSGEEGERCKRCGRACTVWSASSPLWNAVIRGGSIDGEPKYGDMVCAACFMQLAEEQGIASHFRVSAEQINVELETTTPSGRIWDEDRQLWVDPVSEHEATVERLRESAQIALEDQASKRTQAEKRANDLQARLEKVEAERDGIRGQVDLREEERCDVLTALEEAAAGFERRAAGEFSAAWSAGLKEAAQLLREKQAALKGGGADE